MNDYDDIINFVYTGPKNHSRMTREARAGQFASFKALAGYDDELIETRRIVDQKIILSSDKINEINETLFNLVKSNNYLPLIKLTYFIKDLKKNGGYYKTEINNLKKIDNYEKIIILNNNKKIKLDNILEIEVLDRS